MTIISHEFAFNLGSGRVKPSRTEIACDGHTYIVSLHQIGALGQTAEDAASLLRRYLDGDAVQSSSYHSITHA